MPLFKIQADELKKTLSEIFTKDTPWTTDAHENGNCKKAVTLVQAISREQLSQLNNLVDSVGCEIDIVAREKHVSITFS